MKTNIWTGLRIFMGLLYTIFGLNFFFHFLPQPPAPEAAGAVLGALFGAGYFFPLVKITEIAGGVMLLSGRFVNLALILLAPITVNIVAFHLFLDPAGGAPAYLIGAIHLYLGFSRLEPYRTLLTAKA